MRQKPVMLLILDGWGYRKEITKDNAIEQGHNPELAQNARRESALPD